MKPKQLFHERLTTREKFHIGSNRAFGLVFAVVFAAIGLWPMMAGAPPRLWAMALSAGILLISLFRPTLLRHLNYLWYRLGAILHRIVNPMILGLLFFLTITPTALLMRMFGKAPLQLVLDRNVKSYWIKREPPGSPGDNMRRQF